MELINKKDFSFYVIDFLDTFFSDERGYEFKLFVWPEKINNKKIIKINTNFTWKIFDNNNLYANGSGNTLFRETNFTTAFLGCDSDKKLSEMISTYIKVYHFEEKEFFSNLTIIAGISFFHNSWCDTIKEFLGEEQFKAFYATRLSDKLRNTLKNKPEDNKLIKI